MDFKFVPVNLIKSKNEIIARHSRTADTEEIEPSLDLMKLIKKLAELDTDNVCSEALALTNREMEMVSQYLPHNFYKVNMNNLFKIFLIRINEKLCRILFYEWQNSFDHSECNDFLNKLLIENQDFKEIIKECHLTEEKYRDILNQENIPLFYGKEAVRIESIESKPFQEKLSYLGVRETSKLFNQCEFLFYIFCLKNDYLTAGDVFLRAEIKKYDDILKKIFLFNFLEELSLEDLRCFDRMADFFLKITGENHTDKFERYFCDCSPELIRKYVDWTNTYKIHKIFGDDERSVFWERYHHEVITKYSYSNSVVMDFGSYVAVEFLGQAMGPCYIYRKQYFDEQVKKSFALKEYDNTNLRGYLYNQTNYVKNAKTLRNITGTRLIHNPNPGWQFNFDWVLIRNDITERIY